VPLVSSYPKPASHKPLFLTGKYHPRITLTPNVYHSVLPSLTVAFHDVAWLPDAVSVRGVLVVARALGNLDAFTVIVHHLEHTKTT